MAKRQQIRSSLLRGAMVEEGPLTASLDVKID
jgi:hypothetical protein